MTRLLERETRHVEVRCLRRRQLKQELEILRDIFNDAWQENWGFVPFTAAEFADIGELLTLLVDDSFVQIAEIDGRPVTMIVAMPNINEVIRDLDAVRWNLARRGIRNVEMSWILEGNSGMRSIIESCGGTVSKRYRIYEKTL